MNIRAKMCDRCRTALLEKLFNFEIDFNDAKNGITVDTTASDYLDLDKCYLKPTTPSFFLSTIIPGSERIYHHALRRVHVDPAVALLVQLNEQSNVPGSKIENFPAVKPHARTPVNGLQTLYESELSSVSVRRSSGRVEVIRQKRLDRC